MAGKVRVITDSTATFEDPAFVEDYGVAVVPVNVHFGASALRDGIDIDHEEVFHRLRRGGDGVSVSAPPVEHFQRAYQELSRTTDRLCVLTSSQHFTDTYAHAQSARGDLLGRCEIIVIDSLTTSLGLGYLVEAVAQAADDGASLEEVVRIARGVVPRLYSVYYVDGLTHIQRAGLIGETQAILGAMLNIKTLLTIEDGRMIVMEKARTHSQAIDKMVEFVAEFTHIERLGIVQNTLRTTDRTRMLQDRLALEFSTRLQTPIVLYGPITASVIGPEGMGVFVMEGHLDDDDLD